MLEKYVQQLLQSYQINLTEAKRIAECVLKLSDFYIANPQSSTPWKEKWCQIAYISYYFPLNYYRAVRVIDQGYELGFFKKIQSATDFGSGLGSASLALHQVLPQCHFDFIENSQQAQSLHQMYWPLKSSWQLQAPKSSKNDLAIFSYSLTELKDIPEWAYQYPQIMIIEPATHQDARLLMQKKEILQKKNYHIWAPCTHREACPLLTHSKTDWCHDRALYEQPAWLQQIEKYLPIKNQTLTMSYLLASKTPPPLQLQNATRVIGDALKEKGKTRQLICRSPEREFVTWLHKNSKPEKLQRGDLIQIESSEKISNEVRNPQIIKFN